MTETGHVYIVGKDWRFKPLFELALEPGFTTPQLLSARSNLHSKWIADDEVAIYLQRAVIGGTNVTDTFVLPSVWVGGHDRAHYVSDRVRTIIDEFEPGRHHYIRIAIDQILSTGERVPHGHYNLLYNVPFLDPIVPEESMFKHDNGEWRIGSPREDGGGGLWLVGEDKPITLDAAIVGDHHLWRLFSLTPEQAAEEQRLEQQSKGTFSTVEEVEELVSNLPQPKYASLSGSFFCSEQLRGRLEAEGLFGWGIRRRCTLKSRETTVAE